MSYKYPICEIFNAQLNPNPKLQVALLRALSRATWRSPEASIGSHLLHTIINTSSYICKCVATYQVPYSPKFQVGINDMSQEG
jgi:hypothetical protein